MNRMVSSIGVVVAVGFAGSALAAPVTWGAAQQIAGDSDVSTSGVLVGAVNFGYATGAGPSSPVSNTTVNGVTFVAAGRNIDFAPAPVTFGAFTVSAAGSNPNFGGNITAGFSAPFTTLSAPYQELLRQGFSSANVVFPGPVVTLIPLSITVSGLSAGQPYQVQVWSNASPSQGRDSRISDGTNSVDLIGNTGSGLGQYVIGSFIADGTTQTISVSALGSLGGIVNAIQVRQVPTPGAAALLGLGGLMAGRRRRV
jgi:MYXO-CTERM domain-containing protein